MDDEVGKKELLLVLIILHSPIHSSFGWLCVIPVADWQQTIVEKLGWVLEISHLVIRP
jgi:hypothetical protein